MRPVRSISNGDAGLASCQFGGTRAVWRVIHAFGERLAFRETLHHGCLGVEEKTETGDKLTQVASRAMSSPPTARKSHGQGAASREIGLVPSDFLSDAF
jgi:hypothetical protein